MREVATTTIDGSTYKLMQLPAMRAMKLLSRLAAVLGPTLGTFAPHVEKAGSSGALGGLPVEVLGQAFAVLTEKLTPTELEGLTRELLAGLFRDDREVTPATFDAVFHGQIMTVFKLMVWSVEVNFGDFFAGARGFLSKPSAPATPKP